MKFRTLSQSPDPRVRAKAARQTLRQPTPERDPGARKRWIGIRLLAKAVALLSATPPKDE